jgi:hypothetical protein
MKNMIAFAIILGAFVAGAGYLINQQSTLKDVAEFKEKLHKAQLDAARQVAYTAQVPDERSKFEQHNLVATHMKRIEEITKEHPTQNEPDHYIVSREEAAKAGKKDKKKVTEMRERYDYLKGRFEVLQKGYSPALTQAKSGFRFDIAEMKPTVIEGKKVLRLEIFVWGPPAEQITFADLTIQQIREVEIEERGKKKIVQGLAKIEGSGPPVVFHPNPHEWIYEWPPSVYAGYFEGLPLFAPDSPKFTLTWNFAIRTQAGTSMPIELKWENLDVNPAWKAAANDPFWAAAEVQEASTEELEAAGITVE